MRPQEDEIEEESEWIQKKLADYRTPKEGDYRYFKFLENEETKASQKAKIKKVLHLLRVELKDVPFIAHYRKHEYGDELDEDAIWLISNFDQEYGKFLR